MNGDANCSPIHSIPIELPLLTNTHQTFTFFDTVFFAAFFTVLLLFFPFAPPTAFAFLFVRIRMNTTTTIAAIATRTRITIVATEMQYPLAFSHTPSSAPSTMHVVAFPHSFPDSNTRTSPPHTHSFVQTRPPPHTVPHAPGW